MRSADGKLGVIMMTHARGWLVFVIASLLSYGALITAWAFGGLPGEILRRLVLATIGVVGLLVVSAVVDRTFRRRSQRRFRGAGPAEIGVKWNHSWDADKVQAVAWDASAAIGRSAVSNDDDSQFGRPHTGAPKKLDYAPSARRRRLRDRVYVLLAEFAANFVGMILLPAALGVVLLLIRSCRYKQ